MNWIKSNLRIDISESIQLPESSKSTVYEIVKSETWIEFEESNGPSLIILVMFTHNQIRPTPNLLRHVVSKSYNLYFSKKDTNNWRRKHHHLLLFIYSTLIIYINIFFRCVNKQEEIFNRTTILRNHPWTISLPTWQIWYTYKCHIIRFFRQQTAMCSKI